MRLFQGMFLTLAAQALLVVAVPGGLLAWNLHRNFRAELARRDTARLDALAAILAEGARAGRPLPQLLVESERRDPAEAGRVALLAPNGARIAGPQGSAFVERPVVVVGRTVALIRIVRAGEPTADDRRFLSKEYMALGGGVATTFLVLLLAASEIARRWARPQLALHRMAQAVAQGNENTAFDETGPIETAATIRNLGRVARQFERIESARRTWLVSIAEELKKPAGDLARHLEELADMGPNLPPELARGLIEDQRRLAQMTEDLSAVALADLGRLPLTLRQVDPRALIHNAVWLHGKRAAELGIRLETSTLPGHTVLVRWDGERIEQLFATLIENSLRYTPPGGRVVLGLENARDAWRLVIDDSAPGVDVALAQRLFEPFYRSGDDIADGASGLGLATARAIVDAHHGRIEAGNSPIGGLRIVVVLPASPPTA